MNAEHPMRSRVATAALEASLKGATRDPRHPTIVRPGAADVGLHLAIVALTLATAAIHASLGGVLFLANAAGYAAFAVAMVLPGRIGQLRWLVRLGLVGFTATTIGAWFLFGARFPLAYADKGLEVALIACLAIELWQVDGGPAGVAGRARQLVKHLASPFLARPAR